MPPKGSKGGRASRGGRGRGVGLSRPPTPTIPETTEPQSLDENTSTALTAEASQDTSMQDSPNLSPASIPTETPAPTPAQVSHRSSTQRLDSLAPGRVRGRGRGRGTTPSVGAAPPSFKPKAVRRDQNERQRAADEERKRVEERDRQAEWAENRAAGGRGRANFRGAQRGRGDAMGKRMVTISTASGIFSQLPIAKDTKQNKGIAQIPVEYLGSTGYEAYSNEETIEGDFRPRANQDSISRGDYKMGGIGSSGGGGGSGGTSNYVKVKKEVADPVYPGQDNQGDRDKGINIEHINLVSDEDDDEYVVSSSRKGKGHASSSSTVSGLKPIRLLRVEHKERVMVVNTEASSSMVAVKESDMTADDDGLFVPQDLEAERRRRNKANVISRDATGKPWAGVWSDSEDDAVLIKAEPIEDVYEAMDVDKNLLSEPPVSTSHIEEPVTIKEGPSPKSKPRIGRVSGMRDSEAVLQTDEDKAEWKRHQEDVAILSQELGGLQTARKLKIHPASDADGDVQMNDEASEQVSDKEGRLYLFQFPPILPPLYNPNKVKEEKMEDADVLQIATTAVPGVSGSSTAPIDISKSAKPTDIVIEGLKAEPDENAWKKDIQTPEDIIPEEGFIGKLIVRESGKVEMSWGGTSFELSRGAAHDFLMTTLLMDGLDEHVEEENAGVRPTAAAVGLGSVMGKFVVTPDWEKMFVN